MRFLEDLPPTIRRLHITARWITDLDPIAALGNQLRSLTIVTAPGSSIDLTRLPRLTTLGADWQQVRATIEAAVQLRDLYLGHYDEHDLAPLTSLQLLHRLKLKDRPSVSSLTGLERLDALRHLAIVLARNLTDLTSLDSAVGRQLESLELESCRRIDDLRMVARCTSVTLLNLGDIGDVRSAAPLAALQRLVHLFLYESTRFRDGDLESLLELHRLQELRLMNRRHYRPSVDEIKLQVGIGTR